MPTLPPAVAIADAARDTKSLPDVEATAKDLHGAHPEAEMHPKDVVDAVKDTPRETTHWSADHDAHSFVPLTVRSGRIVQEIATLHDAVEFLRHWPRDRRGPVFLCAERSCHAAAAGDMPIEQALQSFASFARIVGIILQPTPGNRSRGESQVSTSSPGSEPIFQ